MKDIIYITVISLLILIIGVQSFMLEFTRQTHTTKDDLNNEIQFIWNDDEESIPKDGSLIQIEMTDENNVYIGPIQNSCYKEIMDRNHIDY